MGDLRDFFVEHGMNLLDATWEHLYIFLAALALGIIVAVPLAVILTRVPKIANLVIGFASILQTVPSLAILAIFIPVLGAGKGAAIVALFLYSLLPILRNTYTGVRDVDENLIESGKGMGMTSWQRIRKIELPLAVPVMMAGVRVCAVYLIGWTTLAAFVGGGGLGGFVFSGLNLYRMDLILLGAIPITVLAVLVDYVLGKLERRVTPKGIRQERTA